MESEILKQVLIFIDVETETEEVAEESASLEEEATPAKHRRKESTKIRKAVKTMKEASNILS